jgi:hypothetical protein
MSEHIEVVMIPPHPWLLDRLVKDDQEDHHKGPRSRTVPFGSAHSEYAATHNSAYNIIQRQPSLPDPTDLGSP